MIKFNRSINLVKDLSKCFFISATLNFIKSLLIHETTTTKKN